MLKRSKTFIGILAAAALAACVASPAFAADASGRSGLEGAAEALRNELAPSMLTFEAYQEAQGAEGSMSIANARVQGLQDVMYTGQPETPTVTLKLDKVTLSEGDDFDVKFSGDNVNPGTVDVTIVGKGAYTGTIETSFTILPGDLSHATIDVIPDQEETGEEICPAPTVKLDGCELAPDIDYTVEYADNVEEGTATILVKGIGNCTGQTRATFEIVEGPEDSQQASSSPAAIPPVAAVPVVVALAALAVIAAFALRRMRTKRS